MVFVKNAKNEKEVCWDCKEKIKIENSEIKNGKALSYLKSDGKKMTILKCQDCFGKSQELKNYQSCEVYSRVVGYLRPVQQWNEGKRQEYKERKEYQLKK